MITFWKDLGASVEFRKGGSRARSDAYASSVKPSPDIREKGGEEEGIVSTAFFEGEVRKEKELIRSQTAQEWERDRRRPAGSRVPRPGLGPAATRPAASCAPGAEPELCSGRISSLAGSTRAERLQPLSFYPGRPARRHVDSERVSGVQGFSAAPLCAGRPARPCRSGSVTPTKTTTHFSAPSPNPMVSRLQPQDKIRPATCF